MPGFSHSPCTTIVGGEKCTDATGITEITSVDGTVVVTNPNGPVTDLSAPDAGDLTGITSADGSVNIAAPGGPVPDLEVDHGSPVGTGTANADGVATSSARSDHVHLTNVGIADEGVPDSPAHSFDFTGAGVVSNVIGGVCTVDIAGGPILEIISDDGSIVVQDGTGPTVNLEQETTRFASLEIDSAMGSVPQGTWVRVPFNVAGPVEVLTQDLGAGAGIGIPEDEGGTYDCEYVLCVEIDDIDIGSTGIAFVMTTGGAPAGANTLNGSRTFLAIDNHFDGLPITHCVSASVLRDLVASDHLELWARGTNPPLSDPISVSDTTGSMEAVRLRKIIPE